MGTALGEQIDYLESFATDLRRMRKTAAADGHDFIAHLFDLAAEEARELQFRIRIEITRSGG